MTNRTTSRAGPVVRTRLASVLIHVSRYQRSGVSRLAQDAGLSKWAVWRLMRGAGHHDYAVLLRVADAIGREIGRPLDLREIAVEVGSDYPTSYVCQIFGCRCLPPWAYGADGDLLPAFKGVKPGEWTADASEI